LPAQDAGPARAAVTVTVFAACVATALVGLVATASPAAAAPATVADTPCPTSAKACLDLTTQQAWLINNGVVTRGPVMVSSGGPGQETPTGTFHVLVKDKNHVSSEQRGTPMPNSVFFAPGGVAFHGGNLRKASAGCVHLDDADALAFYDTLKIGDEVDVRATTPAPIEQQDDNTPDDPAPPPARKPVLPNHPLTLPRSR